MEYPTREAALEAAAREARSEDDIETYEDGNAGGLPPGPTDDPSQGPERCPHCGSLMDDLSKMNDIQLLQVGRTEMIRDLVRSLQLGQSTHQEKAILRGLLRDNKMVGDTKEGEEDKNPLPGDTYEVGQLVDDGPDFGGTEGG